MNIAAVTAVIIFVAMFILVILEVVPKEYITLGSGALMLALVFGLILRDGSAILDILNFRSLGIPGFWIGEAPDAVGIDWATIIFLLGMMIMVEGLTKAGFFRWLCLKIASLVHYRTIPLFITFMVMAAVLAMFIDSITVILFLAAVTIELAKILHFDPVPMIISEIFCSNLGGSATMCGDPPNIIIGSRLHYAFSDFLLNTGVIAGICLIVIIIYFYLVYHKKLEISGKNVDLSQIPDAKNVISSKFDFAGNVVIFLAVIVMLISHASTHLSVAFIGAVAAGATILFNFRHRKEILSKVNYSIIAFFIGLFIVVGGLETTGVLNAIADFINSVSGGNVKIMIAIVLWISAVASAFVDNIPFAATMIPIIKGLAAGSPTLQATLAWTLSIGTDIGGAATPIGASANVVGIAVAHKNGYPVGWGRYCKGALPATIIVVGLSMILIYLRYC
ncbi:MAG: SLC13 family permease [Eubacterium sp.]|nr:SLC13 family permease [Eubacterium sp.]